MHNNFILNEQLDADTTEVINLGLCRVLMMEDARFPWLILVPRINDLRELHHLPKQHRSHLFDELEATSLALEQLFKPDKINAATLGNIVIQLHIHVVARTLTDDAWPGPIWGAGKQIPYTDKQRTNRLNLISTKLRQLTSQ